MTLCAIPKHDPVNLFLLSLEVNLLRPKCSPQEYIYQIFSRYQYGNLLFDEKPIQKAFEIAHKKVFPKLTPEELCNYIKILLLNIEGINAPKLIRFLTLVKENIHRRPTKYYESN